MVSVKMETCHWAEYYSSGHTAHTLNLHKTWKVNYVLDSAKFPSNSTSGSVTVAL